MFKPRFKPFKIIHVHVVTLGTITPRPKIIIMLKSVTIVSL